MITVYGASDDLIEVDGDISAEFTYAELEEGNFLGFSNGVVLSIAYTSDGTWVIRPVAGADRVSIEFAESADSDNYSDRATIDAEASWVVHGVAWSKA